jgi:hypothetical protein
MPSHDVPESDWKVFRDLQRHDTPPDPCLYCLRGEHRGPVPDLSRWSDVPPDPNGLIHGGASRDRERWLHQSWFTNEHRTPVPPDHIQQAI